MGIELISGVVLARKDGYLRILRDNRKADCFDYLKCDGAAKELKPGSRFSLYASLLTVKGYRHQEVIVYGKATLSKDKNDIIHLKLTSEEIQIVYKALKYDIITHHIMREHPDIFLVNSETDRELDILRIVSDRIADKIYK